MRDYLISMSGRCKNEIITVPDDMDTEDVKAWLKDNVKASRFITVSEIIDTTAEKAEA